MPFGNPCQIALDAKCYAVPVETSIGLRERKKLRTRADLHALVDDALGAVGDGFDTA